MRPQASRYSSFATLVISAALCAIFFALVGCASTAVSPVQLSQSTKDIGSEVASQTAGLKADTPAGKLKKVDKATKTAQAAQPLVPKNARGVVVIDAGHQRQGNSAPEPIGPGAGETKAKVTGGTSGRTTGVPEYEVNLEVAKKLQSALQAKGITVIMVRETNDVDISNSQRAKVGNDAHADLVIRLHCDGSDNTATHGFLTLVPAQNKWTGPIVSRSKAAGEGIHAAVLASTGATDRGIQAVGNMTGFNWSEVPTVICEMGLMTNPAEDRLLSDPSYQGKIVDGIAAGTVSYLNAQ